ncbi:MAG: NAD(P)H-quinone oxidoreductase [Gemmatimonadota bacterium]
MRAVVITEPGAPNVLRLQDVPDPVPAPGEVRVRVEAAGINRADLLQRQGHYPAPPGWPADIPGLEYTGVVDALGPDVGVWAPGDRVMGLVGGGAYAEYVVVPADEAIAVPDPLDTTVAAAIPEAFITAHDALRTRIGIRGGETLLIHAVGSGVGTAALQLADAWGVRVLGTSRSEWKLERATSLGLDVPIRAETGDFADAVLAATGRQGVPAILDLVGGDYLEGNLRCVSTLGRIVVVGLTRGRRAILDMGALLRRRVTLVGTVLRSRSSAEKAAATRAFARDGLRYIVRGRIEPPIHEVLPMAEAARGHALLESNETFGKVVLAW